MSYDALTISAVTIIIVVIFVVIYVGKSRAATEMKIRTLASNLMMMESHEEARELCRKIREKYPTACIYALTGHSTLFELADCREAGFDDYFTKPIKLETLHMAVEQAFDRVERWRNK